jgi:hypothetical protein
MGGSVPADSVVEVFDDTIAKLQASRGDRYQGGIQLRMTLAHLDEQDDLRRFVKCVSNLATKFSPALLTAGPTNIRR